MKNFQYIQPENLKEASQIVRENPEDSVFFAGGTDLLGLLKDDIVSPEKVVNLKSLPKMDSISYLPGKGLKIGALTKIVTIAENPIINQKFPVLAQAAREVATPQLRNVGTIAGNICQRPRCWYYRNDFACLRKNGDECFAPDGENKHHCIIGGDPCYIVHPSDMAIALSSLQAKFSIFSGRKTRTVQIDNFFVLPETDYLHENILEPGEIITEIQIPDLPEGAKNGYLKFKERDAWDFAMVSVAAVLQTKGTQIKSGRIAIGGVAPIPWIEAELNSQLAGMIINEENLKQLAQKALSKAEPLDKNEYKLLLAQNLIKRLLKNLTQ